MYLTVVDRKLGDQRLTLVQLDQQYWKSQRSIHHVHGLSAEHKVKRSTTVRTDLKKFPCKTQIKQNIKVADNKRESLFVIWLSDQIEEKTAFVNNIWFNDEACFHMSGHVNKQNMKFWRSVH